MACALRSPASCDATRSSLLLCFYLAGNLPCDDLLLDSLMLSRRQRFAMRVPPWFAPALLSSAVCHTTCSSSPYSSGRQRLAVRVVHPFANAFRLLEDYGMAPCFANSFSSAAACHTSLQQISTPHPYALYRNYQSTTTIAVSDAKNLTYGNYPLLHLPLLPPPPHPPLMLPAGCQAEMK
jgi:hypothetical protein